MNINFTKVLSKIGGVAADASDYDTILSTWDSTQSSTEKCPPFFVFADTWKQMVYSGEEVGTWKQEREKGYASEGITIEKNMDLIMEYTLAVSSGDEVTAAKYKTELEVIHAKRQAIKVANPKQ